ncbi:MAG: ABC transporter ATP-binding protein [Clostridia bacterium]
MITMEVKNVSKSYGKVKALEDVDLIFGENKIYGLLGRNGAGKTTLLNLMTNKLFPDQGSILLEGMNVMENDVALNRIFYMTEKNLYPLGSRCKELFKWTKAFYQNFDLEYAKGLAKKFDLDINKKVKDLSTGYASIFKAILALASNAEVLIFDEPILGLDAYHRDMLYKEILKNYIAQPKTVIISTHLIEEVSDVLEEVIIIKKGRIMLSQPVEELLSSAYTVSGESSKVERYITGRKCIQKEALGNFQAAVILGQLQDPDKAIIKELGLNINKAELQKLFISLTNSQEGALS